MLAVLNDSDIMSHAFSYWATLPMKWSCNSSENLRLTGTFLSPKPLRSTTIRLVTDTKSLSLDTSDPINDTLGRIRSRHQSPVHGNNGGIMGRSRCSNAHENLQIIHQMPVTTKSFYTKSSE
jgi:hypothetical protein